MRRPAFWPVAALSWVVWLAAVTLFYSALQLPMPPLDIVLVIGLFYLPALLVGIWAGRPGTLAHWSRGRLVLTCALALVGYLPLGLATFPLLPLTAWSLVLAVALLVWGWHHQRGPGSDTTVPRARVEQHAA